MRKNVVQMLRKSLSSALQGVWPSACEVSDTDINGVVGFRLGVDRDNKSFFVAITPLEGRDSFRTTVAWGYGNDYPESPFRDLAAPVETYKSEPSAEVQLAYLVGGHVPYEWLVDPEYAKGDLERKRIGERIANGEQIQPEEWIRTLHAKPCSVESARQAIDAATSEIVAALERVISEISKGPLQ